jgi:hypothetical protein
MQRALLRPPENLDAWESFHRGLWHCFRFTAHDNERAHAFLRRAVELDPRFSRACAGLSVEILRPFLLRPRSLLRPQPQSRHAVRRAQKVPPEAASFSSSAAGFQMSPSCFWKRTTASYTFFSPTVWP